MSREHCYWTIPEVHTGRILEKDEYCAVCSQAGRHYICVHRFGLEGVKFCTGGDGGRVDWRRGYTTQYRLNVEELPHPC